MIKVLFSWFYFLLIILFLALIHTEYFLHIVRKTIYVDILYIVQVSFIIIENVKSKFKPIDIKLVIFIFSQFLFLFFITSQAITAFFIIAFSLYFNYISNKYYNRNIIYISTEIT